MALRYRDIRDFPGRLFEYTGLTANAFERLVPIFERCYRARQQRFALGRMQVRGPYRSKAQRVLETPDDRLLFVLSYLKHMPTQAEHGAVFGLSQSNVSSWLNVLLPVLEDTMRAADDLPVEVVHLRRNFQHG